jgi:hypothetical protein
VEKRKGIRKEEQGRRRERRRKDLTRLGTFCLTRPEGKRRKKTKIGDTKKKGDQLYQLAYSFMSLRKPSSQRTHAQTAKHPTLLCFFNLKSEKLLFCRKVSLKKSNNTSPSNHEGKLKFNGRTS